MLSGQDIPSSWPESHGLKEVLSSWRKPQLNTCWHAESNAIRSSGVKASEPSAYLPEKAMEKAAELQCFLQDPELHLAHSIPLTIWKEMWPCLCVPFPHPLSFSGNSFCQDPGLAEPEVRGISRLPLRSSGSLGDLPVQWQC